MGVTNIRPDKNCEHDFKIMDVIYDNRQDRYNTHYYRFITFYCTKCLQQVEEKKHETVGLYEATPTWYKNKEVVK